MRAHVLLRWSNFLKIITLQLRHAGRFLNVNIIVHVNFRCSLCLSFQKSLKYQNFAEVSDKYPGYLTLPMVPSMRFALCCAPTTSLAGTRDTRADKIQPLPTRSLPSIRKTYVNRSFQFNVIQ